MKRLIYLVQGRSDLVEGYFHLAERENADALFLTYDKKIENAIFFPNSKWSEGRNKLLEQAKKRGQYDYYIFCDDDIKFRKGSWDEFERLLLKYKPAIGHPLFIPKAKLTPLPFLESQVFCIIDQQLVAYHKDLVSDGVILPYQHQHDEYSWWISGSIANLIIRNFYSRSTLQFNNIVVLNTETGRYDGTNNKNSHKYSIDWFANQCNNGFKRFIRKKKEITPVLKLKLAISSAIYQLVERNSSSSYKIERSNFSKFFKNDSVFLKQYDEFNHKS